MKIQKMIPLAIISLLYISCDTQSNKNNFEILNKSNDGKLTMVDQKRERLLVVNSNNRIDDVIDLDISSKNIDAIKKNKETQDKATKIKTWPLMTINGTEYKIALSTRYYKDRMLYTINFTPYNTLSGFKSSTISIKMNDENGFTLERIIPSNWTNIVNEKAEPYAHQTDGSVPMSLENYLEITNCSPLWR